MTTTGQKSKAPFAYDGLERALHEQARLGIMTSLVGQHDGLAFTQLKALCDLTDGNLNRHLKVLEDAGYVKTAKSPHKRETRCFCTDLGHAKFVEYIEELKKIIKDGVRAHKLRTK